MLYKVEGIIIKLTNLGEADRIVHIYTREQGLIKAVAKGCKRPKSRLSGRIELFCQNNFVIARGKNLDIISQADILNNFYALQKELTKIQTAAYIARVINQTTLPQYKSQDLFILITEIFSLIAKFDQYEKIKRTFQNKFLELEGLSDSLQIQSDEQFEKILYNVV